ncbi:coiled-coil domain-containing protein [Anaerosporobacter faecicola]|uniref:hypothetical protein n=1 Tax=Anaerosporobacter faecicola TaxID=2718714 RepID=UPI00143AD166|nr:hypothetical protein [Anaerosporobacter faecicola]
MPHINRLRVNNVKYNFGTQYYDDFMMKPYGKNMLYDLANGGGKSVLMLLLLQTVIPNCTLDDKQPVEKLFRTSQGSSTIHSLIEWKLNDEDIKDGFQYMTTGFCARKGTSQEEKETASIDYFTYCIFYREYNENDIRNLPLINENERVTYSGLKQYLKDLQREPGLKVEVFDRKGEYQQFISNYGIYESEWEIIRGINKTEGHVRTYFETNYKTTRKVVEDLLIEEIIQKSYNRYLENAEGKENEETMAGTLLSIKDKLIELSQKKAAVNLYDRQIEIMEGLKERVGVLDHVYSKEQEQKNNLHYAYQYNENCLKDQQEEYTLVMEEIDALDAKKKQLEITVEAVKLRKNEELLKEVLGEIEKLEKEITLQNDLLNRKQNEISLKESMNDYLEYLEEKRNRDELKESLDIIKDGSKVEVEELNQLAYNKKILWEQKQEELEATKQEITAKWLEAQELWKESSEEERNLDIQRAIKENQYNITNAKLEQMEQEVKQMRKQVNLLFLEETKNAIEEGKKQQEVDKAQVEEWKQEIEQQMETMASQKLELQKAEEKKQSLCKQQQDCENWMQAFEERKRAYEKLLAIYHVVSKEHCLEELEEQYKALLTQMVKCKEKIQVNERYLTQLMDRNLDVDSEGLNKVKEYLGKRYHDQVTTGTAYLQTLSEKERENLLKQIPLLPYALIIMRDYEMLLEDRYFRRKDFGPYAIPILNLEEIKQGKLHLSKDTITFAMKEDELFYREDRMAEEESIVRSELEEEKENLRKLEAQEDVLKKDMDQVRYFKKQDLEQYQKMQEEREQITEELVAMERTIQLVVTSYEKDMAQVAQLENKVNEYVKRLDEQEEELLQLTKLQQILDQKQQLEQESKQLWEAYDELEKHYKKVCETKDSWSEKERQWKVQVDTVDKQLSQGAQQWITTYLPYYKEEPFEKLSLTEEEIDARFRGKKDAFEKEYSDLGDKERLLNSYINAMNRSLKAIAKRKISLATLEEMKQSHTLTGISEDMLQSENADLLRQESVLSKLREDLENKKAFMHQLGGKIEEARVVGEEKFGTEFGKAVDQVQPSMDMEEQKTALQKLEGTIKERQEDLKQKEQERKVCENAKEDMERIYRQLELAKCVVEEGNPIADITVYVQKLGRTLESTAKEIGRKREEFSQQVMKTAQTLELLHGYELAQELREGVQVPKSLEESAMLQNNLEEVCACIRLERNRVEQGLEDMERIKQSFENQCLQRCDHVKAALERLPKLSKIMLDNEQIPMIGLSISYVEEELQKQRMSDYIDSIVAGVDEQDSNRDKIAYIKAALSLKRLFAVIVTDMNRIKLTLYKRERIKEQSRHLRYEEAVGSTGQSQGIYIQFLIAIVNYITYMNSGNMDNTGLRKVIFIDNPFGAAKDIYIWEPIFELLKMNHVQLIVPARGTTPAITGKFDVNYILGQRLNEQKQQTVVVDYHSSVDTSEVEYIPLQYEQTSLFE